MIELNTCKISRRGKGAKGTVEVQTFGIPILDDNGIAKEWDYSSFAKLPTAELIVFLEQFGNVNLALLQGFDLNNKSAAMKAQNETLMLAARIIAMELAEDKETATNVAAAIIKTRKNMLQIGVEPENLPSIDFLLEKRASLVDKERKAKGMAPRLVKPVEVDSDEEEDQ